MADDQADFPLETAPLSPPEVTPTSDDPVGGDPLWANGTAAQILAAASTQQTPADTKSGTTAALAGDTPTDKGFISGILDKMRSTFGFTDDAKGKNDFAKAALPVAGTIAGGLIAGAGAGYAAEQKRKIEAERAANEGRLIDSQVALNTAKTGQNLGGLLFTPPPGAAGAPAPFAPAKLTPVSARRPA